MLFRSFVVGMIGAPAVAMILPLAPTLSRLFFGQVISARYMSILGVSAVLMFYQMASGAILNVTGYQRFHICTAVGSELLQLLLMFFLCASPRLGIYGYLYAALLASLAGALGNFILLRRVTGGVLRLKRLALLPAVCAGRCIGGSRGALFIAAADAGGSCSPICAQPYRADAGALLLHDLIGRSGSGKSVCDDIGIVNTKNR